MHRIINSIETNRSDKKNFRFGQIRIFFLLFAGVFAFGTMIKSTDAIRTKFWLELREKSNIELMMMMHFPALYAKIIRFACVFDWIFCFCFALLLFQLIFMRFSALHSIRTRCFYCGERREREKKKPSLQTRDTSTENSALKIDSICIGQPNRWKIWAHGMFIQTQNYTIFIFPDDMRLHNRFVSFASVFMFAVWASGRKNDDEKKTAMFAMSKELLWISSKCTCCIENWVRFGIQIGFFACWLTGWLNGWLAGWTSQLSDTKLKEIKCSCFFFSCSCIRFPWAQRLASNAIAFD